MGESGRLMGLSQNVLYFSMSRNRARIGWVSNYGLIVEFIVQMYLIVVTV